MSAVASLKGERVSPRSVLSGRPITPPLCLMVLMLANFLALAGRLAHWFIGLYTQLLLRVR